MALHNSLWVLLALFCMIAFMEIGSSVMEKFQISRLGSTYNIKFDGEYKFCKLDGDTELTGSLEPTLKSGPMVAYDVLFLVDADPIIHVYLDELTRGLIEEGVVQETLALASFDNRYAIYRLNETPYPDEILPFTNSFKDLTTHLADPSWKKIPNMTSRFEISALKNILNPPKEFKGPIVMESYRFGYYPKFPRWRKHAKKVLILIKPITASFYEMNKCEIEPLIDFSDLGTYALLQTTCAVKFDDRERRSNPRCNDFAYTQEDLVDYIIKNQVTTIVMMPQFIDDEKTCINVTEKTTIYDRGYLDGEKECIHGNQTIKDVLRKGKDVISTSKESCEISYRKYSFGELYDYKYQKLENPPNLLRDAWKYFVVNEYDSDPDKEITAENNEDSKTSDSDSHKRRFYDESRIPRLRLTTEYTPVNVVEMKVENIVYGDSARTYVLFDPHSVYVGGTRALIDDSPRYLLNSFQYRVTKAGGKFYVLSLEDYSMNVLLLDSILYKDIIPITNKSLRKRVNTEYSHQTDDCKNGVSGILYCGMNQHVEEVLQKISPVFEKDNLDYYDYQIRALKAVQNLLLCREYQEGPIYFKSAILKSVLPIGSCQLFTVSSYFPDSFFIYSALLTSPYYAHKMMDHLESYTAHMGISDYQDESDLVPLVKYLNIMPQHYGILAPLEIQDRSYLELYTRKDATPHIDFDEISDPYVLGEALITPRAYLMNRHLPAQDITELIMYYSMRAHHLFLESVNRTGKSRPNTSPLFRAMKSMKMIYFEPKLIIPYRVMKGARSIFRPQQKSSCPYFSVTISARHKGTFSGANSIPDLEFYHEFNPNGCIEDTNEPYNDFAFHEDQNSYLSFHLKENKDQLRVLNVDQMLDHRFNRLTSVGNLYYGYMGLIDSSGNPQVFPTTDYEHTIMDIITPGASLFKTGDERLKKNATHTGKILSKKERLYIEKIKSDIFEIVNTGTQRFADNYAETEGFDGDLYTPVASREFYDKFQRNLKNNKNNIKIKKLSEDYQAPPPKSPAPAIDLKTLQEKILFITDLPNAEKYIPKYEVDRSKDYMKLSEPSDPIKYSELSRYWAPMIDPINKRYHLQD